jgi:hypothetical protein
VLFQRHMTFVTTAQVFFGVFPHGLAEDVESRGGGPGMQCIGIAKGKKHDLGWLDLLAWGGGRRGGEVVRS